MNDVENSRVQTIAVAPAITLFLQEGPDVAEQQVANPPGQSLGPGVRGMRLVPVGAAQSSGRARCPRLTRSVAMTLPSHSVDTPKAPGERGRCCPPR